MTGEMTFEDRTGQPPTAREAREAEKVVSKYMVNMEFMVAHPELTTMLPTIRRICGAYAVVADQLEKRKEGGGG